MGPAVREGMIQYRWRDLLAVGSIERRVNVIPYKT